MTYNNYCKSKDMSNNLERNLGVAESRVFILEAVCLTLFKRIRQK